MAPALAALSMVLLSQAALQHKDATSCFSRGFPSNFFVDRESGECFKIGEQGPCKGKNMIFYGSRDQSIYGVCDCNYWLECKRPLLYWPEDGNCYFIHSQGPCSDNQWLSYNTTTSSVGCTIPQCTVPDRHPSKYFTQVWPNGRCYVDGERGPCPIAYHLFTNAGEIRAKCRRLKFCAASPAPPVPCGPGHKYTGTQFCPAPREVDYSDETLCDHGSKWDSQRKICILKGLVDFERGLFDEVPHNNLPPSRPVIPVVPLPEPEEPQQWPQETPQPEPEPTPEPEPMAPSVEEETPQAVTESDQHAEP